MKQFQNPFRVFPETSKSLWSICVDRGFPCFIEDCIPQQLETYYAD